MSGFQSKLGIWRDKNLIAWELGDSLGFLVLSPVVRSIPKWLSSHVHGLQAFLNRRTCKLPYSIILGMDLPSKGRTAPKFLASGYPSQHPARGDRKQSLCHIFVKTCMLWLEPNCLLWKLVSPKILLSLKQHFLSWIFTFHR